MSTLHPIKGVCTFLSVVLLALAATSVIAQSSYQEQEAEEVERLKVLLKDYYSEEERRAAEAASGIVESNSEEEKSGEQYELAAVALSGTEGISALEHISKRLEDDSLPTLRRETDIIFNVEVRREGKLVSSQAYSLKALGKAQYIAKVALLAGDAVITVRKNEWPVNIAGPRDSSMPTDFLITLNAPRDRNPELHLISVADLKSTNWTQLPPWLPFIGALPSQS